MPNWLDPGHASPADLAACRASLRGGSRTFLAASLFLPRRVREPACALYAFCRAADDAVDLGGGAGALADLRARLDRVYAGRPAPVPADRALADVVRLHAIPRALPDALLEGFAWDAAGRTYDDLPALTDYAVRVAGTVGAMMALLMGERSRDGIARACDLGVAMQLTNVARDVGEDARAGRLYLPRAWLREAGLDPEGFLADPAYSPALGAVVARLLAAADALYARAEAGIARLPRACRPGIRAASRLYAEIGRGVAAGGQGGDVRGTTGQGAGDRVGHDSVSRRAVVPASRKLRLAAGALRPGRAERPGEAPPLPEAAFLVDAVAALPPATDAPWTAGDRVVWMLDLFGRLDRGSPALRAEEV